MSNPLPRPFRILSQTVVFALSRLFSWAIGIYLTNAGKRAKNNILAEATR